MKLSVVIAAIIVGSIPGIMLAQDGEARSEAASEKWIDLLDWAEGGDWKPWGIDWNSHVTEPPSTGGITFEPGGEDPLHRFPLPAIVDGDYDAEFSFIRHSGTEAVGVYFPVGGHNLHLGFGGANEKTASISSIGGKNYSKSPLSREPSPVENGVPHRIAIRVRHHGERASFEVDWDDEKKYFQWSGPISDLWNREAHGWRLSTVQHFALWSYSSHVTFNTARVRAVTGSVQRSWRTPLQQGQDRRQGIMRLVDVPPLKVETRYFAVNQIPLWKSSSDWECVWPLVTSQPQFCRSYLSAHAPSKVTCPIPAGAKSFSVQGYNDASRSARFLIEVDGRQMYASGLCAAAEILVDLPEGAQTLTLIADDAGDKERDHVYWCHPCFHPERAADVSREEQLAEVSRLPVTVQDATVGHGKFTKGTPLVGTSGPLTVDSLVPCHEFVFAYAPSSLVYRLYPGASRFESIGYCPSSLRVAFQVFADGEMIYQSPQAGIAVVSADIPKGAKELELRIDPLGDGYGDRSMWCFPRVMFEEGTSPPAIASTGRVSPLERELGKVSEDYERAVSRATDRMKVQFDIMRKRLPASGLPAKELLKLEEVIEGEQLRFEKKRLVPFSAPMRSATLAFLRAISDAESRASSSYAKMLLRYREDDEIAMIKASQDKVLQPFVVARWRHQTGSNPPGIVECLSNGRIGSRESSNKWLLSVNGVFELRWPNAAAPGGVWIDSCRLTQDGLSYKGENQHRSAAVGSYASR